MTEESGTLPIDDPLSYETPEEPTAEWLSRAMITDFAVYQLALQANPSLTTPQAHKNRVLRAYGRGSLRPKSAVNVLRWVYTQELNQSDRIVPDELGIRYISSLRKLLDKPDDFFVEALAMSKPVLAAYDRTLPR